MAHVGFTSAPDPRKPVAVKHGAGLLLTFEPSPSYILIQDGSFVETYTPPSAAILTWRQKIGYVLLGAVGGPAAAAWLERRRGAK